MLRPSDLMDLASPPTFPPTRRRRVKNPRIGSFASIALLLCLSTFTSRPAFADELPFYWYFDTQDDYTIPSCNTISIGFVLNPNSSAVATAPYTLIAYAGNGVPNAFPVTIPDFEERWSWRVAYPQGTQLLLSFVDSQGLSGGVGPLYTVVGSAGANCSYYSSGPPDLTYSFNVTSAPLTCQSVGAAVSGGVPPYTLTQLVSGDTAHNSTFSTSQVSYQNTLSAGATYMISISDSVGNYADTSSLTYSGGGGATYCLTGSSDGPKSGTGDASPTPKPKGSGNHKSTTAIVGAIIAVAAVIVSALIFWYYRRKHKKQTQELLNARGGFNGYPGGGFGNHNDATLAGGSSGYPGRPGEKFASPMENAGGGWRPESPTEYPGGAGAPVRFRVMNPDDDERSEASVRTTRSAYKTRNGQNQRRSLIEGDHNSLYPPTVSTHRSGTRSRSGTTTYGSEAGDQPWPTFSSNASSTEDHYMDHPASSAGNIAVGSGASRNDGSTGLTSDASFLHSRQPSKWSASSTDLSDVGDEEGYTDDDLQSQASGQTYRSGGHTGLFRAGSSSSNAYGSPFADSQRVQDR